ncbi:MAG TPA: imelysin family protein, partial [Verrucomicrobiae bacterium]|nr:imelysin family protein [Verrucomicrobiae bacterium]
MPARTMGSRPHLPGRRTAPRWLAIAGALLAVARAWAASPEDAALHAWLGDDVAITARAYARALAGVEDLHVAVTRFLDAPSERTLSAAREAWRRSRESYEPTEVFRFSDGPIDGDSALAGREGPENRINAWPVDEAYLDSVAGSPRGGIIPQLAIPMDRATLEGAHGSHDVTEVTLGFHAIEFLLWGQDRDTVTAGRRPYTDFIAGNAVR